MYRIFLLPFLLIVPLNASPSPIVSRPLASQLVADNPAISSAFLIPPSSALLENVSTSGALRVPPSWSFSIGFSGATFLPAPNSSQKLSYEAQLEGGKALPDWLVFAKETITFGGVTPSQSHGIQVLRAIVTATSSAPAAVSDSFTLIIAPHDLSLTGPLLTRNVTADNKFSLVLDDWQGILVDGTHAPTSNSGVAVAPKDGLVNRSLVDTPNPPLSLALNTASFPWLTFDPSSRTLSGTPPASLVNAAGPSIPALVTLSYAPQPLTVSTNLTLNVLSSAFTASTLPPLLTTHEGSLAFSLAPFLIGTKLNITATSDATWITFDEGSYTLHGGVPSNATSSSIKVTFEARDQETGAVSQAEMVVSIGAGTNANGRNPTDRALRNAGQKVSVAVGVVVGVLGGVILLACFLAVCRQCCAAHEHVDGAYVIDQSAFDDGLGVKLRPSLEKGKRSLEKVEAGSGVDAVYLARDSHSPYVAPSDSGHNPSVQGQGRMISKAAFFSAVRDRFGSDGSWRGNRAGAGAGYGSGKRARKSKISKPMVVLSSSTSVREGFGFGDRRRERSGNFTIFGNGNHAGTVNGKHGYNSNTNANDPPPRPPRSDLSLSLGPVLMSPSAGSSAGTAGTAVLAYDRSRSNSDPSHKAGPISPSRGPGGRRSGSAPSLGTGSMGTQTGTGSGTQSTFATGDSARLTNAAGEVPFRRPGFDGRRETLAERSLRETGSPGVARSPGPILPPLAKVKAGGADLSPTSKVQQDGAPKPLNDGRVSPSKIPSKAAARSTPPKATAPSATSTPMKSSKSSMSNRSGNSLIPGSASSKLGTPSHSGGKSNAPLKSSPLSASGIPAPSGSRVSLAVPSSYRNVFFADKGGESDSSAEDVERAIIKHAVKRSSSETPIRPGQVQQAKPGKPRLVAFTHEKTPATGGQSSRREVSQKAVLHGEESDPEAVMRIGLEYVRQLGHPESKREIARVTPKTPTAGGSLVSDPTRTPSAEFYALNDSNGSIAGRTRVVAPMIITSHRNRHQAAYSTASAHDSFLSFVEHEEGQGADGGLPQILLGANEPFNFAAPLERSTIAGSALEAKQADGSTLPEWLRFDKGEREFWGVPPKAGKGVKAEARVAHVIVKIWEAEEGKVVGGCVIDVMGDGV